MSAILRFIKWIKSRLPVSSRSFHKYAIDFYNSLDYFVTLRNTANQIVDRQNELQHRFDIHSHQIDDIAKRIDLLLSSSDEITRRTNMIFNTLSELNTRDAVASDQLTHFMSRTDTTLQWQSDQIWKHDAKNENMFWYTMGNSPEYRGKTFIEIRRHFFHLLPNDNGSVRSIQIIIYSILQHFVDLCNKHNLTYWLWGGTLLGAIRNNSFIPWDDDGDICMPRDDFTHFVDIIKQSNICVLEYYYITGQADGPAKIPKLRLKNTDIPVFLDIFPFDETICDNETDAIKEYNAIRHELESNMNLVISTRDIRRHNSERITDMSIRNTIDPIFSKAVERSSKGNHIRWGSDLFIVPNNQIAFMCKDILFPLKTILFEGIYVCIPKQPDRCLKLMYGDYYKLPSDVYFDFHSAFFGFDKYADQINAYISANKLALQHYHPTSSMDSATTD